MQIHIVNELEREKKYKQKPYVSFSSYTLHTDGQDWLTTFCGTFRSPAAPQSPWIICSSRVIQLSHFVQEPHSTTFFHSTSPKNYFRDVVSAGGVYFQSFPHPRTECLPMLTSWGFQVNGFGVFTVSLLNTILVMVVETPELILGTHLR